MAAVAWASASQASARPAVAGTFLTEQLHPSAARLRSLSSFSLVAASGSGGSSSSETWRRPTWAPSHTVARLTAVAAGLVGVCVGSQRWRSRRRRDCRCMLRASAGILEKRVLRDPTARDEVPRDGDLVRIHYVGRLEDGTIFDSSRWRRQPFEFHLGEDDVIDGWHMLIATMAYGERAELVCPPAYAYGEEGYPDIIPPNETLTFDVELLEIGRPMPSDKPAHKEDEDDDEDKETELLWQKDEERGAGKEQGYSWQETPTGIEIEVRVLLPDNATRKDLEVKIGLSTCSCNIKGTPVLDGKLFAEVQMDDSGWDLEKKDGKSYLIITLAKLKPDLKWPSLLAEVVKPVEAEVVDIDSALRAANAAAGSKKGSSVVDV